MGRVGLAGCDRHLVCGDVGFIFIREGAMDVMNGKEENIRIENKLDKHGNPAGGCVIGTGIRIDWQNGPLGRGDNRQPQNGAFVEDVLGAALNRLRHYQTTRFKCRENEDAIIEIEHALNYLKRRTKEREDQGVEGTHVNRRSGEEGDQ